MMSNLLLHHNFVTLFSREAEALDCARKIRPQCYEMHTEVAPYYANSTIANTSAFLDDLNNCQFYKGQMYRYIITAFFATPHRNQMWPSPRKAVLEHFALACACRTAISKMKQINQCVIIADKASIA